MTAPLRHVPANYSSMVPIPAPTTRLDTCTVFQISHDDSMLSPIDQFITNTLPLNLMWAKRGPTERFERFEGVLLVLGYVSAVESYMRALIRRVLVVDEIAKEKCHSLTVSYAAAQVHGSDMLPEALLEEHAFSGAKGITSGLIKFLGVDVAPDKALVDLIDQYGDVCEIRHCCVHRFGKLGTKNAVELGLESHRALIEKPVELGRSSIEVIASVLATLVKSINNHVMAAVLNRSVWPSRNGSSSPWTWIERKDWSLYRSYYAIFASTKEASPSATCAVMYRLFKNEFKQRSQKKNVK
ncbi:hypothetical protein DFR29_12195 [Tahibacter aquaticus]|uniref:Uncharacterized protein n=1 Tax=Tahibacter aquaticus TaxID=520092 RepID=A0A4R6YM40_9GAMM|nr:hypothetical protein [Tahibacter aquaticus]TDR38423.1 hypothetical protein DFR29_12195 [Tahibacter aquaticus]